MEKQNTPQKPRRIPYGMMNFVAIREENCYYVDKTRFIEKVEDSNRFFFFNRPRRFGKSLTMSMLRHYYDINQADKFEQDIELAKAQICRYADTVTVGESIGNTALHKVYVVYRGVEMMACDRGVK